MVTDGGVITSNVGENNQMKAALLTVTLLGLLVSGTLEVQAQAYVPYHASMGCFHISGQYSTSGRQHSRTSVVFQACGRDCPGGGN